LGLETAGVALTESGAIAVDSNFTTNIPSVFALGDVTGKVQLTPVAIKEAMHLLAYWFESQPVTLSYDNIPSAVFSQPNIGTVGLSEQEAVTRGFAIDVYQTDFRPMKHTLSGAEERSFMKLIVDQATDRVLGVHVVGDHAGEIIQGMGIAVTAGAKKADFDATIGVHPTAAEEFVTFSPNALKKR
jgi:glutathione reductase (NADPH)